MDDMRDMESNATDPELLRSGRGNHLSDPDRRVRRPAAGHPRRPTLTNRSAQNSTSAATVLAVA
jgi:hypothetical protein